MGSCASGFGVCCSCKYATVWLEDSINDVRKILWFFDPLPPCPHFHATSLTIFPYYIHTSVTPFPSSVDMDVINGSSLKYKIATTNITINNYWESITASFLFLSVSLSCGAVSDQNNTYFTNSLATTDSSPCTAKVNTIWSLIIIASTEKFNTRTHVRLIYWSTLDICFRRHHMDCKNITFIQGFRVKEELSCVFSPCNSAEKHTI